MKAELVLEMVKTKVKRWQAEVDSITTQREDALERARREKLQGCVDQLKNILALHK